MIVPTILILAMKFLFDAVDNFIEFNASFVIFKMLIFIFVYLILLFSFNVFKFIKERRIIYSN